MRERPILFSAPMVRAILEGRKSVTRRIMRVQPKRDDAREEWVYESRRCRASWSGDRPIACARLIANDDCPYGVVGDRLWVKETIRRGELIGPGIHHGEIFDSATYAADGAPTVLDTWPWKRAVLPAIHMPRGLRRLTLEVTGVRVERLQDITEEDAQAEGIDELHGELDDAAICAAAKEMGTTSCDGRAWFAALWDSINGTRAPWASNCWVWVISFKRVAP